MTKPKQRRRTKWGCRDTETAKSKMVGPNPMRLHVSTWAGISESIREFSETTRLETYR